MTYKPFIWVVTQRKLLKIKFVKLTIKHRDGMYDILKYKPLLSDEWAPDRTLSVVRTITSVASLHDVKF